MCLHACLLVSQMMCDDIPTEVAAMSSGITYFYTAGNDFGALSLYLPHHTTE